MENIIKNEIIEDFRRAKNALISAKENLRGDDIFTSANRLFVACENAVYSYLKLKFGTTAISRQRIIMRLGDINPIFKNTYESSYDIRVQADYGRKSRIVELNKENVKKIMKEVEHIISIVEIDLKNADML